MLALVLASALAATPRPLPNAPSGIYVPQLDRTEGVVAFMQRAGERSVLLRPSTWFSEFHPLLFIDFTRPDSLEAAGIQKSGSATVSHRKDGRMTCLELSDPKRFDQRTREKLSVLGTVWESKVKGVPVVAAKGPDGTVLAGHATKGKVSCAFVSSTDAKDLMEAAAGAVTKPTVKGNWASARKLPGALVLVMEDGAAGLSGEAAMLELEGRSRSLPIPAVQKGSASPYAGLSSSGMLVAHASVSAKDAPRALHALTREVVRFCDGCSAAVNAFESAVAPELTGHVAFGLRTFQIRGRLRTPAQRFFAAKQAWLAQVDDTAKVKKALANLSTVSGAKATDHGWVIPLDGGEVQVGLRDRHLYLANDAEALEALWSGLPTKGTKVEHGAEFVLGPRAVSQTLASISLFDVVGSKELAGLFAAGTELGPVLSITDSLTGWADGGGDGHRFGVRWKLNP